MTGFRFAVQGGPFGDPVALAEHARKVESLGYDELWSFDHIGAVDPFAPLLAAALATERLRVGPLVLNNELHHPALLARTAATIDQLTTGRLTLGFGTGYQLSEHTATGIELRPPGPRVTRLGESLAAVRALLDTGAAHIDGEHHTLALDDLGVRPVQEHVPFLIGGHGRRVVGLAGQFADIFQFTGLEHAADGAISIPGFDLAELDRRAEWLAEAAGDRDPLIERSALVQALAVDGELAQDFGVSAQALDEVPFVLAGSVEQIVDKLGRLRERLGITHYVVRDPDQFAPVVAALR
ncbi:MAG TPA: TIGR03621 family F420-dependent LLM class oxidoreductase [Ilumatobacter sp.]|nr:TIGR03621 family F420-dependent LLM class oxidoreductase [Ilumatobacter sp.]